MLCDNNTQLFFALIKVGLWCKDTRVHFDGVDYSVLLSIAERQSVTGLVNAGLTHILDNNISGRILHSFGESTLNIERKNQELNLFIEKLIGKLRDYDIYAVIVGGKELLKVMRAHCGELVEGYLCYCTAPIMKKP